MLCTGQGKKMRDGLCQRSAWGHKYRSSRDSKGYRALGVGSRGPLNELQRKVLRIVNTLDKWYRAPLQATSAGGYDQITQRLLEARRGRRQRAGRNGSIALQAASAASHDQIVKRLLDAGPTSTRWAEG